MPSISTSKTILETVKNAARQANKRTSIIASYMFVLLPSLRIGCVVLPQRLLDSFEQFRRTVHDHGPLINQATLADFMEVGALRTRLMKRLLPSAI